MCIVKDFVHFIGNGANVFREASRGQYTQESKSIMQLKKELFIDVDKSDDKAKLNQDRKTVAKDINNVLEKLKLIHS